MCSTIDRLSGKGLIDPFLSKTCVALTFRIQDGYTLETLDIHTIEDGVEKVIIHNVRTSSDNLYIIHLTHHDWHVRRHMLVSRSAVLDTH